MPITDYCNPDVVCCEVTASLAEVASLMRAHHVGDIVVVGGAGRAQEPLGIVTDRDIVVEAVAPEIDLKLLTAGDIMTAPVATVRDDAGVLETLRNMDRFKVRRLPVVRADGSLCGIVSADDLIRTLVTELSILTRVIAKQSAVEAHERQ